MTSYLPPVLEAPSEIVEAFQAISSKVNSIEFLENLVSVGNVQSLSLVDSSCWRTFAASVRKAFASDDHVVLKGLPLGSDGASLLLATLTVGSSFRTYREGKIVKYFRMSPWTSDLSHTIQEGEFHTDLNTELHPPAVTAMQCADADPGAPRFGLSRIVRLVNLLTFLKDREAFDVLGFLTEDRVTMLNDRSSTNWSGTIIHEGILRYHPETLRAACRRAGIPAQAVEAQIASISDAAFAVSEPFCLDRGDVLLLSNHRTLHYRGECSVTFNNYPLDFASRSIFILHANGELKNV